MVKLCKRMQYTTRHTLTGSNSYRCIHRWFSKLAITIMINLWEKINYSSVSIPRWQVYISDTKLVFYDDNVEPSNHDALHYNKLMQLVRDKNRLHTKVICWGKFFFKILIL